MYRKDRTHPTKAEVTFTEYDNSKIRKEGKVNQYGKENKPNTWDEKPAVMIHKVAMVTALRNAFPNELGGLYEVDELREPKDVTPQESREDVVARKMAEIEQFNKEQSRTDPEPAQTEEPIQGELLDGELEY